MSYVKRWIDAMSEFVGVDPDVFVTLVQDCPGVDEPELTAWAISKVC